MAVTSKLTVARAFPYILFGGGLIGTFCSVALVIEKMQTLAHPGAALGCDINPIVACGPVINTPQSSVFGFSNPLLGIIGFSLLIAIGAGMLAGATYKRWFWLGLQAGLTLGIIFATWLQFQTIYRIGALCPFCIVVWSVIIPLFLYTTVYNLRQSAIHLPAPVSGVLQRYHLEIMVAWYVVIAAAIFQHFWYFWRTVL